VSSNDALALALLGETMTRAQVRRLIREHGGPVAALSARGWGARRKIRALAAVLDRLEARLVGHREPGFPERLAAIPDPPLVLSLRGDEACFGSPSVAIVGARRASVLGLETARTLARTLAELGVVVVSGLALGIDGAAHAGALESGRRRPTIAVLGSGLGMVQPIANLPLARDLVTAGGLLVSEYAPYSRAARHTFPERNRLISGLADVVVVVEASERSGSLITARLAAEQGRDVLAVPGHISQPNSRGANMLIKQGAGLADGVQDVLQALGLEVEAAADSPEELGVAARRALDVLDDIVTTLDQICAATAMSPGEAGAALAELELAGIVTRTGGGYSRRPFGRA